MNEILPTTDVPQISARGVWEEMKDFAKREPLTAVAAVATVGLLIKLVPNRWLVTAVGVVGTALVRPAVLSLAFTKAMEMCFPPQANLPKA